MSRPHTYPRPIGPYASGRRRLAVLTLTAALVAGVAVVGAPAATADAPVTTWTALAAAFTTGGSVSLGGDITQTDGSSLAVGDGTTVALDLAGHTLSISSVVDGQAAISVTPGSELDIADSLGAGSLDVAGGLNAAGIGGDTGATAGTVKFLGGAVTATGGTLASAVGGGTSGGGGQITMLAGSLSAIAGSHSGGIGAGYNSNAQSSADSGSLTVGGGSIIATGGFGGAGVGGGLYGNGATVSMSAGSLTATGGQFGAGIGGGFDNTDGGTLTLSGGTVSAQGGEWGAGVGGGVYGAGAGVDVTGGLLTASSESQGAGIGGGYTLDVTLPVTSGSLIVSGGHVNAAGNDGAGVGAGYFGDGAQVTVGPQGSLTASGNPAIGGAAGYGFGSLTNNGEISIPAGSVVTVPSATTIDNAGVMVLDGTLTGTGTVTNTGSIVGADPADTVDLSAGLSVTQHHYLLTFDINAMPTTTPDDLPVYATSVSAAGATLPVPTAPNYTFTGWFTAATGGTQVTSTSLLGPALANPTVPVTALFAQYTIAQMITFTAPISPATGIVDGSHAVTADGGASGAPVVLSVLTASRAVCSLAGTAVAGGFASGATVSYLSAGTCTIDASQAGDSLYTAGSNSVDIAVSKAATTVSVTPSATTYVYGQPVTGTATTSGGNGRGQVQFTVDGTAIGAPVTIHGASAISPALTALDGSPLTSGSYQIGAVFTPTDTAAYTAATAVPGTVTVNQAATASSLTVQRSTLTVTVTPVAPGAGTPHGSVTFSRNGAPIGTSSLVGGVATLTYSATPAAAGHLGAVYSGDADFAMSTASTSTARPTITARLRSSRPVGSHGWYRTPVTVSFTCTAGGSVLTRACPAAVTISRSGSRTISRSIATQAGGTASVTVRVNLDRTAPTLRITGVSPNPTLPAPSRVRCAAADHLSGLAGCTITRTSHRSGDLTTVIYTAVATDRAGNTGTVRARALVSDWILVGGSYRGGAYTVHRGHTYTLYAVSSGRRPRYIDASPVPRSPGGAGSFFHHAGRVNGELRWAVSVEMTPSLRHHRYWNIGIEVGRTLHILTVRVLP